MFDKNQYTKWQLWYDAKIIFQPGFKQIKMLSMIKKTLVFLALFFVVPVVVLVMNYQWSPESLTKVSQILFWFTETAGTPWAVLSCVFFALVFACCLKVKSKANVIKLVLILAFAILSGQVVKSAVKRYTAEPRPYVLWLEKTYQVDHDYFYSLPGSERKDIIKQNIHQSSQIPKWLYQHWRNETGYSFPSGHTLFATTWAFLALVLLGFKRHRILVSIITAWAVLIELSRIDLGMHHPLDLISGAILAWVIALLCYYLARKWKVVE